MNNIEQIIETIEDECFTAADDYEAKPETASFGQGVRRGASLALKHIRGIEIKPVSEPCDTCAWCEKENLFVQRNYATVLRTGWMKPLFCPNCGRQLKGGD